MYGNGLSGTIPTQIGMLDSLRYWDMYGNGLSGTIPTQVGMLNSLTYWAMPGNGLSGTIPTHLGSLTSLAYCSLARNKLMGSLFALADLRDLVMLDLSENQLTDHLPLEWPPSIQHVFLQRNRLGGTISPTTEVGGDFVLFGNRIEGSVPSFAPPSNSLFLFNNLLSCSLPPLNNTHHGAGPNQTLVALGNQFLKDGINRIDAKWLHEWDIDSKHLFIMYPRSWVRLAFLLLSSALLFGALRFFRRSRGGGTLLTPQYFYRCRGGCLGMLLFSAFAVVGLAVTKPQHRCADLFDQVALYETTSSVVAVCCVLIHALLSVFLIKWLRKENTIIFSNQPRVIRREENSLRLVICLTIWIVTLLVLQGPVFLHLVSGAFPSNNSFGLNDQIMMVLRGGLVTPWLVLNGEWIIPKLSGFLVARVHPESGRSARLLDQGSVQQPFATLRMMMILSANLLSLVVAPIAAGLFVHNRCFGNLLRYWQPCASNGTESLKDIEIKIYIPEIDRFETYTVPLRQQVCDFQSQYDGELCARGVIAAVSTLNISKVIYQALFVLVRVMAVCLVRERGQRASRVERWAARVVRPSEEGLTRSVAVLMLQGLMLGGVAPLIWAAILVAIQAIIVAWKCLELTKVSRQFQRLWGRRVFELSVVVQLGFGVWLLSMSMSN